MRAELAFLVCLARLVFSCPASLKAQQPLPTRAATFATRLYRQVIARHPIGIPEGKDLRVFGPYLSSSLLQEMDQYRACVADWDRRNANSDIKSPVGLFENDIFSGPYEEATPKTFHVETTQPEDDGLMRVYVKLTSLSPPAPPLVWRVALLVSREHNQFAVRDVIYLKDESRSTDERLTEYFSRYCKGSRYIGRQ